MRRARLHLEDWTPRLHRRAGFWQAVGASLALIPLAWAAWLRLGPSPELPGSPPPGSLGEARAYFTPQRESASAAALETIAGGNLFAPSRSDWALATVAEADAEGEAAAAPGERQRAAALKAAEEELDRLQFRAVMRVGERWTALFDSAERGPADDLIALRQGDTYKGWSVMGISKDGVRLDFDGHGRALELMPRPSKEASTRAIRAKTGRSRVEVRPVDGVTVEPPISLDEAERRLRESMEGDDPETLKRLDDLLKDLRDEDIQA